MIEFKPFPKIARLSRDIVITEKIDGTNAQVTIIQSLSPEEGAIAHKSLGDAGDLSMFAGSRSRWLDTTSKGDNFGFAKWVFEHSEELWALGVGTHFGEWWGPGIQRGYGLAEKTFSLFNTHRWGPTENTSRPACCNVVPTLYVGPFDTEQIDDTLGMLGAHGSQASPGFMRPEGIVVFHKASGLLFKKTLEDDAEPKSLKQAA